MLLPILLPKLIVPEPDAERFKLSLAPPAEMANALEPEPVIVFVVNVPETLTGPLNVFVPVNV